QPTRVRFGPARSRPDLREPHSLSLHHNQIQAGGAAMKLHKWLFLGCALVLSLSGPAMARARWTATEAKGWDTKQPWGLGANYLPSNAINELEMWQKESFDPKRIDQEFGWAQGIGMNVMRVFLHNALWDQDPEGFKQRMGQFLDIAARHKIR